MTGLSSYVAKQCRYALHLNHLPATLRPAQAEPDPVQQLRADLGQAFEAEVGETIMELHPDALTVEGRGLHAEAATLAAMDAGTQLIWNASLPEDVAGRRTGLPDLLVRVGDAPEAGRWRYAPVDVKNHGPFAARTTDKHLVVVSDLDTIEPNVGSIAHGVGDADDLLQLAHYWRMLQALERAPRAAAPLGGIIGKADLDPVLVWLPLDLDTYDDAFHEAIVVIDEATLTTSDPLRPRLAHSFKHSDCGACVWNPVCAEQWVARDDLTLVVENRVAGQLAARGVTTRTQLAALDLRTAWLLDKGAATEALSLATQASPLEPLPNEMVRDDLGLASVVDLHGLVSDLERLNEGTYRGKLFDAVLSARAQVAGRALLRPGAADPGNRPPRADIEIDVDMEDFTDWCYLWGTYTSVRVDHVPFELTPGYRAFAAFASAAKKSFATPTLDLEAQVTAEFWTWIEEIAERCRVHGLSFRLYCFAGPSAENKWLRKLAARHAGRAGVPSPEDVEALIESDAWVDIYTFTKRIWVTPKGNGLKNVAPIAGHRWASDDDGGAASLLWFREAITGNDEARHGATQRLLEYNASDVLATLKLREHIWNELSST